MKTGLLLERGINLWETPLGRQPDLGYASLTLISHSAEDLASEVSAIFQISLPGHVRAYRWHTEAHALDPKLEKKIAKMILQEGKQFAGTELIQDKKSRVITFVACISLPITAKVVEIMNDHRRELMILCDRDESPHSIGERLLEFAPGVSPSAISQIVRKLDGLLLCRFVSDVDTHHSFQMIGDEPKLIQISEASLSRVTLLDDRAAASMFINRNGVTD